jgi:hypothetical protein
MDHPTADPWPAFIVSPLDTDQDGKPGVTAATAQGSVYSDVPVEIPTLPLQQPARANALYLAIRQVTIATATVKDCGLMTGTVQIPPIKGLDGGSKYAIDSHVLGCALEDGTECTRSTPSMPVSQAAFVDNSEPVFTPTGVTSFRSMRLPPSATCADVRGMR